MLPKQLVKHLFSCRLKEMEALLNSSSHFSGSGGDHHFDVGEVCCAQSTMDDRLV